MLQFLQRARDWFGKAKPGTSKGGVALDVTLTTMPVADFAGFESYLKAACTQLWASWKACDLVAQVVCDTPLKVVKRGTSEPLETHPLQSLFMFANATMTWRDLMYITTCHIKMVGCAFIYKAPADRLNGDTKGRTYDLIPLNPKRVKVVPGKNRIDGYIMVMSGQEIPFTPEEIIYIRKPNPNNDWLGMGEMEAGQAILKDTLNRQAWGEKVWSNGAALSGILSYKERVDSPEEWNKLKEKFRAEYQGRQNVGKVALLNGPWEYTRLGLTLEEMQDIERQQRTLEQIFALHGVPLSVAGLREAANYATAELDDARFRRYTVQPVLRLILDTLNSDLLAEFGEFELAADLSGLTALGMILGPLSMAFDRGIVSINEARVMMGLTASPENLLWEQHFISAGLVPLELAGVPTDGTAQAAKGIVDRFTQSMLTAGLKHNGNGNGHHQLAENLRQ
jgi:HK97 family phage portal protein